MTDENNHLSTTERVFEAVRELRAAGLQATRETVAEITRLKQVTVDDRLRALTDDGRLVRILRGIYDLAKIYQAPRQVFVGEVAEGYVKLEIGDTIETLTPEESRKLARLMSGFAHQAEVIETTRQHLMLATDLAARLKSAEQRIAALTADRDQRQLDWVGEKGESA